MIFIDGDTLTRRLPRFRGVQPLVRDETVLCWHDYWMAGVPESVAVAQKAGYRCIKVNSSCEIVFGTRSGDVFLRIQAAYSNTEPPRKRRRHLAHLKLYHSLLMEASAGAAEGGCGAPRTRRPEKADPMDCASLPQLSVVVVIVGDTVTSRCDADDLARTLAALHWQADPPGWSHRAVHSAVEGIEQVRSQFPEVRFLPVEGLRARRGEGGSREHHDELRARGMAATRGEIIAFLEDHVCPILAGARASLGHTGSPMPASGEPSRTGSTSR